MSGHCDDCGAHFDYCQCTAQPSAAASVEAGRLPADVVALVIAAREAWEFLQEHYPSDSVTGALEKAVERFDSRVCYDDEGGDLPEAHADPCTCGQVAKGKDQADG